MSGSRSPPSSVSSRKSSTVQISPSSDTSYAFLNFSHPSEAKDQKARRAVRSHVTKQQHQKEQLAAAAVRRSNNMPHQVEFGQSQPPREHNQSASSSGRASSTETSNSQSPPTSPASYTVLELRDLYPISWLPYVEVFIDHHITSMAREILGLTDHARVDAFARAWKPFVFTDAALLHATLLMGATSLGSRSGSEMQSHPIDTLQVKGRIISAINESIQNQTRPVNDHIIAAVLSLAQYEAFWGEQEAFTCHMGALQNMIHMRGGLAGIRARLNGLLERVILAVDHHASQATGTEAFFGPNRSDRWSPTYQGGCDSPC